ncbi:MAG: hypothetical protein ABSD10_04110 [Candidatus Saccharimonadales bacterium]|jgi:hypothetical protein
MLDLLKKNSRRVKKWSGYFAGSLLVVVVILGIIASFSSWISQELFIYLAFLLVVAILIFAYFRLLSVRSAVIFIVTVAILLAGVYWSNLPRAKSAQFQAVFLTNGQVYFGHLHDPETQTPTITDVYYLQSGTSANPQASSSQSNQKQPLTLIKLGNELHGPEDKMAIQSTQILFWENLKDSSKVVQAIKTDQPQ